MIDQKIHDICNEDDVKPMWEDENNKNGGCFSLKSQTKMLKKFGKNLL